ncbi:MAG: hypothetical protein M1840_008530 [Geoglossum simile]|nr:MAG: hypothetical protein M1840_008530 [Geoglossum simile]
MHPALHLGGPRSLFAASSELFLDLQHHTVGIPSSMLLGILSTCVLVRGALAHASIDYPPCIGMAINGTKFPDARNGSSTLPGNLVLTDLALHNARVAINYPLRMNGTDFPCKFRNGVSPQFGTDSGGVAEWTAGSNEFFNFTANENVAAHGGGSCQVSLSFDGGNNFQVIRSFVGGCPGNATFNSNNLPPRDQSPQIFDFTIPKDTPNGHAIFAWTWFPISGNISMHMNCAWVNISGGINTGNRTLDPDDYPPMFVANVKAINTCRGRDGFKIVFPTPGKFATTATGTETAGTYSITTPTGNCTALPSRVTSTATETITSTSRIGSASSTAKATATGAATTRFDARQAWRQSLVLVLAPALATFIRLLF